MKGFLVLFLCFFNTVIFANYQCKKWFLPEECHQKTSLKKECFSELYDKCQKKEKSERGVFILQFALDSLVKKHTCQKNCFQPTFYEKNLLSFVFSIGTAIFLKKEISSKRSEYIKALEQELKQELGEKSIYYLSYQKLLKIYPDHKETFSFLIDHFYGYFWTQDKEEELVEKINKEYYDFFAKIEHKETREGPFLEKINDVHNTDDFLLSLTWRNYYLFSQKVKNFPHKKILQIINIHKDFKYYQYLTKEIDFSTVSSLLESLVKQQETPVFQKCLKEEEKIEFLAECFVEETFLERQKISFTNWSEIYNKLPFFFFEFLKEKGGEKILRRLEFLLEKKQHKQLSFDEKIFFYKVEGNKHKHFMIENILNSELSNRRFALFEGREEFDNKQRVFREILIKLRKRILKKYNAEIFNFCPKGQEQNYCLSQERYYEGTIPAFKELKNIFTQKNIEFYAKSVEEKYRHFLKSVIGDSKKEKMALRLSLYYRSYIAKKMEEQTKFLAIMTNSLPTNLKSPRSLSPVISTEKFLEIEKNPSTYKNFFTKIFEEGYCKKEVSGELSDQSIPAGDYELFASFGISLLDLSFRSVCNALYNVFGLYKHTYGDLDLLRYSHIAFKMLYLEYFYSTKEKEVFNFSEFLEKVLKTEKRPILDDLEKNKEKKRRESSELEAIKFLKYKYAERKDKKQTQSLFFYELMTKEAGLLTRPVYKNLLEFIDAYYEKNPLQKEKLLLEMFYFFSKKGFGPFESKLGLNGEMLLAAFGLRSLNSKNTKEKSLMEKIHKFFPQKDVKKFLEQVFSQLIVEKNKEIPKELVEKIEKQKTTKELTKGILELFLKRRKEKKSVTFVPFFSEITNHCRQEKISKIGDFIAPAGEDWEFVEKNLTEVSFSTIQEKIKQRCQSKMRSHDPLFHYLMAKKEGDSRACINVFLRPLLSGPPECLNKCENSQTQDCCQNLEKKCHEDYVLPLKSGPQKIFLQSTKFISCFASEHKNFEKLKQIYLECEEAVVATRVLDQQEKEMAEQMKKFHKAIKEEKSQNHKEFNFLTKEDFALKEAFVFFARNFMTTWFETESFIEKVYNTSTSQQALHTYQIEVPIGIVSTYTGSKMSHLAKSLFNRKIFEKSLSSFTQKSSQEMSQRVLTLRALEEQYALPQKAYKELLKITSVAKDNASFLKSASEILKRYGYRSAQGLESSLQAIFTNSLRTSVNPRALSLFYTARYANLHGIGLTSHLMSEFALLAGLKYGTKEFHSFMRKKLGKEFALSLARMLMFEGAIFAAASGVAKWGLTGNTSTFESRKEFINTMIHGIATMKFLSFSQGLYQHSLKVTSHLLKNDHFQAKKALVAALSQATGLSAGLTVEASLFTLWEALQKKYPLLFEGILIKEPLGNPYDVATLLPKFVENLLFVTGLRGVNILTNPLSRQAQEVYEKYKNKSFEDSKTRQNIGFSILENLKERNILEGKEREILKKILEKAIEAYKKVFESVEGKKEVAENSLLLREMTEALIIKIHLFLENKTLSKEEAAEIKMAIMDAYHYLTY